MEMIKPLLLASSMLLALFLPRAAVAQKPFIRVEGRRLMEGDRPFYFVGANLNVMHGEKARRSAARTISAAVRDGLRVGRVWALGEGKTEAPAWQQKQDLFRSGPDGWHEDAFLQLDRVIAEAGKQGLRLVITLSNHWKDYGGIPMYLHWAGQTDHETYGYKDRFFSHPQCRAWFLAHLRRVVGRTNSITGVPYRDDPTIMTWELQNELHGTPEGAALRRQWVKEMARVVRKMAPGQLVVPGTLGYNLQQERREWIAISRLPEVSYCDQHIYPEEHLRSRGTRNMHSFIDDRVQLAHHVLNKPMVFGEFGFADKPPAAVRIRWHRLFLNRIFFDGGNGAMAWIYQPTLSWKRRYGILIDRRRHRGLRRALRAVSQRLNRRPPQNRNSLLGPAQGDRPIAGTHALLKGRRQPHGAWARERKRPGQRVLRIPVDRFHSAWFEEAGTWSKGVLVHVYGRRTGWLEYRFKGPGFVPARLQIRARLSSEYPGRVAPPFGFSRVEVMLDGGSVAALQAIPDNGVGAWHTVAVQDADLRRRLRRGIHTLRLKVSAGPQANGVAVYGREARGNKEPVTAPGPLQIIAVKP